MRRYFVVMFYQPGRSVRFLRDAHGRVDRFWTRGIAEGVGKRRGRWFFIGECIE